jgi:hypothetical protein
MNEMAAKDFWLNSRSHSSVKLREHEGCHVDRCVHPRPAPSCAMGHLRAVFEMVPGETFLTFLSLALVLEEPGRERENPGKQS